jgi:hypothetical protein
MQRAVLDMAPASLRLAIQRRQTPAAVRNDTVDLPTAAAAALKAMAKI